MKTCLMIPGAGKSCEAESLQDLLQGEAMMGHDLIEDGAQCAGTKRVVVGDGQVMFAAGPGGESGCEPSCRTNW